MSPSRSAALLLGAALAACAEAEPELPPGLGDPVPDATLEVVEASASPWAVGDELRLSDLRGRPVVLDFWASWCGPCRDQHAFVTELVERWGEEVHFVGILYEDSPENARVWLEEQGATYPTVVDAAEALKEAFWIRGIPRFVLLDAEGRLAWDMMGDWGRDSVTVRLEAMVGP